MTWNGLIVCPLLLAVSWGIVRGLNWLARARQAEREAVEAERLAEVLRQHRRDTEMMLDLFRPPKHTLDLDRMTPDEFRETLKRIEGGAS